MAGCPTDQVIEALGLTMAALFEESEPGQKSRIVAEYDYRDEKGVRLYQAVRFEPKDFRQRRPLGAGWIWSLKDVRRVLYRLPELLASTGPVFIAEGEKDCDALAKLGLNATTNVGGAGKWKPEYSAFLKGRDVVILPDNDAPGREHALQVSEALAGVARSVLTVALQGIPEKGDVSDWLAAGGTKDKLLVLADSGAPKTRFIASPDRMVGELDERLAMATGELTFGVKFLDDALGGILKRDLILVGAKTGVGKTSLATIAALANCRAGKRVHYFALEAEEREIERRMKFQIIAARYYAGGYQRPHIRYLDWYRGKLQSELGQYEREADVELRQLVGNLLTFYRIESFTSDDFAQQMEAIKDETDLAILDHLHYVDADDKDENRAMKRTVKQIRDSALRSGKPVLVVAHVRKGDRRNEQLVPGIEDFHGSSDISKIATKAIMLAPAYEVDTGSPFLWSTYMQISKCRQESALTRYVAQLTFDTRKDSYMPEYVLGKLTSGGTAFSDIAMNDWPRWYSQRPLEPTYYEREPGGDDQ
jgi:RecA/RadA recombinase